MSQTGDIYITKYLRAGTLPLACHLIKGINHSLEYQIYHQVIYITHNMYDVKQFEALNLFQCHQQAQEAETNSFLS